MELRKGSKRSRVALGSAGRVEPPVELVTGTISADQADSLLRMVQSMPEGPWLDSNGQDREEFLTAKYNWIDLPSEGNKIAIPAYLSEHGDLVRESVGLLLHATGCRKLGRAFINRFSPHSEKGMAPQYVMKPHVDSGRYSAVLSLRPAGSEGGCLYVSALAGGELQFRSDLPDTVETRRGKVKQYLGAHGDLMLMRGCDAGHYVSPTHKMPRYSLVVFGM